MNIFKKAKQATAPTVTAEMIQREIVDKQDKLVAEARATLASVKPSNDKVARLRELGFTSTKEVVEAEQAEQQSAAAKRVADAEQEAATRYPGFKFISKDVMSDVCAKYGLLLGGVDRYKGEVPECVMAALEKSGAVKEQYVVEYQGHMGDWIESGVLRSSISEASRDAAIMTGYGQLRYRAVTRTNLLIAAPVADMIVRKHERVDNGRIIKVEDPIVCVEVSGGYVVLAAWGEEGQDPRVFNSNLN